MSVGKTVADWKDFEVLNLGKCTGSLTFQGDRVEITFRVNWIGRRRIQLELDPIPLTAANMDLAERLYRGGEEYDRRVPFCSINAQAEDGREVTSHHASVSSYSTPFGEGRSQIKLNINLAQVEVRYASQSAVRRVSPTAISVEYINKGQLGFRRPAVDHDLGEVWLAGEPKKDPELQEYTGVIGINTEATSKSPEAWLEEADRLAVRVSQMLSLAHGRLFYWEIRKVFIGDAIFSFTLRPQSDPKNMRVAVFHQMDLQTVLELAVKRYTVALDERTGIEVALSWFLSSTSTSESGFLHLMTSLEHLVHVFSESAPSARVVPRWFLRNVLRPAIQETLERYEGEGCGEEEQSDFVFNHDLVEELVSGFNNANRRSFRTRLGEMLAAYAVDVSDFQEDIPALIAMRNDVVHRGSFQFDTTESDTLELERLKNVAEELLVRLFLTILDHTGNYNSPLYDLDWRPLPRLHNPTEESAAEPASGEDD